MVLQKKRTESKKLSKKIWKVKNVETKKNSYAKYRIRDQLNIVCFNYYWLKLSACLKMLAL